MRPSHLTADIRSKMAVMSHDVSIIVVVLWTSSTLYVLEILFLGGFGGVFSAFVFWSATLLHSYENFYFRVLIEFEIGCFVSFARLFRKCLFSNDGRCRYGHIGEKFFSLFLLF